MRWSALKDREQAEQATFESFLEGSIAIYVVSCLPKDGNKISSIKKKSAQIINPLFELKEKFTFLCPLSLERMRQACK